MPEPLGIPRSTFSCLSLGEVRVEPGASIVAVELKTHTDPSLTVFLPVSLAIDLGSLLMLTGARAASQEVAHIPVSARLAATDLDLNDVAWMAH